MFLLQAPYINKKGGTIYCRLFVLRPVLFTFYLPSRFFPLFFSFLPAALLLLVTFSPRHTLLPFLNSLFFFPSSFTHTPSSCLFFTPAFCLPVYCFPSPPSTFPSSLLFPSPLHTFHVLPVASLIHNFFLFAFHF